jgi:hypothetical protein
MGGDDAGRSRRAKRAAATAVVAAAGLGFGVAALGLGAAAFAAGEWRHRRDGRGAFAAASPGRRRRPLSDREWRGAIDREGRVAEGKFASVLRRAASDGVAPDIRPEVWPLLLGVRRPESTAVEQEQRRRDRRAGYDALLARRDELEKILGSSGPGSPSLFRNPGTNAQSARSRQKSAFGTRVFAPNDDERSSLNPYVEARVDQRRDPSRQKRDLATYAESVPVIRADVPRTAFYPNGAFETHWRLERDAEYEYSAAKNDSEEKETKTKNVPTWQAAQSSRLTNVLVAYALHDPSVGYCQGMNEVAARFLENVVDESEAFWCFAAFLEAYRPHFVISVARDFDDDVTVNDGVNGGVHVKRSRDAAFLSSWRTPGRRAEQAQREKTNQSVRRREDEDDDRKQIGSEDFGFETPPPRESVRDVLRDLGVILRRCDPPLWKHVRLLHAQECMFAFRAVVVLLARELPPPETTFLWEALMASGDHLAGFPNPSDASDENASESDSTHRRPIVEPGGAGNGRMLLHCVAAVFVQARHLVFGCREFDDLLHASHHAVSKKCFAAAPLLESARRLMAQPWRGGADARQVLEE